jgi:rhodanese-related sulfurtransferase
MKEISVTELKRLIEAGSAPKVVDVREPHEYETDHIDAENIPMGTVPDHIGHLLPWKDQDLVICCRSGGRSGQITMYLSSQGFSKVQNLKGGMLSWKDHIDPEFNVS